MKLVYGEVVVDEFADREQFIEFCQARIELEWTNVSEPDGDPNALTFVYLKDPTAGDYGTHIHELELSWLSTRPRVAELAQRLALICDLAPVEHVGIASSAIGVLQEIVPAGSVEEWIAAARDTYGSLTKAWRAGVEGLTEMAQLVVASIDGPAYRFAPIERAEGLPPALARWRTEPPPTGPLLDPIQEAIVRD